MFGASTPDEAAKVFLDRGPGLVLITFGGDGSVYYTKDASGKVPSFPIKAVDTTGAGDNFMGAFLSRFILGGKSVEQLTPEDLSQMLRYANAAGAICASRYGAIAGQASEADIQNFLNPTE
jgi:fructokinase